jgi:hypothetical protein
LYEIVFVRARPFEVWARRNKREADGKLSVQKANENSGFAEAGAFDESIRGNLDVRVRGFIDGGRSDVALFAVFKVGARVNLDFFGGLDEDLLDGCDFDAIERGGSDGIIGGAPRNPGF